jgi:hypothetical protein
MDDQKETNSLAVELTEYRGNPCPQTLRPLANRGAEQLRRNLIEAFRDAPHWRIAQHLALAWANKLGAANMPPDLTRAAYFAHVSCQLSHDHPWARLARASIYWERRLTYLVLEDVARAATDLERLDEPAQAQVIIAQLDSLRVCALAYDGRVAEAIRLCEQMCSRSFGPTDEAFLQCFISTRPSEPEPHHRAAMLSARGSHNFGQRPMGLLIRAVRAALLRTLAAKCAHDV